MVTHQLQVERRTGKVRQSETDVLPRYTNVSPTAGSIINENDDDEEEEEKEEEEDGQCTRGRVLGRRPLRRHC